MYFAKMPNIYYDFIDKDGNPTLKILKDITTNVRLIKSAVENITMYDYYDIRDGETPEIVAAKVYGNSKYHWIIMLSNKIYDYRQEWPLTFDTLDRIITQKYGDGNEYKTHHYENAKGLAVNSDYPLATPISNYDFETRMNEKKRRIKLVSKPVLDAVIKEYTAMFK
jgi:hypothetical protein